ncbi:MAG: peptidylprolyl isomerase [Mariprofundaceae bacterium]|nr:peptidylprolyl isomerase [Mariprofundaceae bacterium]
MQISKHKAVTIHYTLTGSDDAVIDSSRDGEPLDYIHGLGILVPGLEEVLEEKTAGDRVVVTLPPKDGYGERSEELLEKIERNKFEFDGEIEVGMRFEAETQDGVDLVEVIAVDETHISIDANHPLAGKTLHFDVEVIAIRDATEEEVTHGHVHGEEGCGH